MYERLSYEQLCRQLVKCNDPVTILNIIQDLLEYPNNTVFNDFLIYNRIGCCLNSASECVKKKALLVLYRCLIFIEEDNTNELVNPLFNYIIACAFSDLLEMKRISLQCLIIIISNLSTEEFIPCITSACETFLKPNNRSLSQKFSFVIREIFAKLPNHLNREYILEQLERNIENDNDFHKVIYNFIVRNTSSKGKDTERKYQDYVSVLKSDIFPGRFSKTPGTDKTPTDTSKNLKYQVDIFNDSMQILAQMNHSQTKPRMLQKDQASLNENQKLNDYNKDNNTENSIAKTNLSCKIQRKFPNEYFQDVINQSYHKKTFSHQHKQIWNGDDIYRPSDRLDLANENIPSYYLESIRKSASKKRDALFKTFSLSKSALYDLPVSNECVTPFKDFRNEKNFIEEGRFPIIENKTAKSKFMPARTASCPYLLTDKTRKLIRNQTSKPDIQINEKKLSNHTRVDRLFAMLTDSDWQKNCDGLLEIQKLMSAEQVELIESNQLRPICSLISGCTKNLRSQVSRLAIQTLNVVIQSLGHKLDFISDLIAEIIIGKAGEINRFIRDDLNKAMKSFLLSVSFNKSLSSLSKMALNNRNGNIRKLFSENLNWLTENNMNFIISNEIGRVKLIEISNQLSTDSNEDTRHHAREILKRIRKEDDENEEIKFE